MSGDYAGAENHRDEAQAGPSLPRSPLRFERIGRHDYYDVYDGDREIGQVIGGGPTRDTRWKAISPGSVGMNPRYRSVGGLRSDHAAGR